MTAPARRSTPAWARSPARRGRRASAAARGSRTARGFRPASSCSRRRRPPTCLGIEQRRHHVDRARRIEHVHRRLLVRGRNLHRRVLLAGRRAADQQRQREAAALHLARDEHHLVERRRDEPAQARPCRPSRRSRSAGSCRSAPSRRGRSPRSCCSRAPRRRCSCRCRGRRP